MSQFSKENIKQKIKFGNFGQKSKWVQKPFLQTRIRYFLPVLSSYGDYKMELYNLQIKI